MIKITSVIYFMFADEEVKKVHDVLRVVELMYKDKIKIRIVPAKVKKASDKIVVYFNDERIYENYDKIDTYVAIVNEILNKNKKT